MNHTPEPWVIVEENDGAGPIEVRAPPYIVARIFSDPATYTIANARLIVAAPRLLKKLEAFADFYAEFIGPGEDLDRTRQYREARELIAEIRGGK